MSRQVPDKRAFTFYPSKESEKNICTLPITRQPDHPNVHRAKTLVVDKIEVTLGELTANQYKLDHWLGYQVVI